MSCIWPDGSCLSESHTFYNQPEKSTNSHRKTFDILGICRLSAWVSYDPYCLVIREKKSNFPTWQVDLSCKGSVAQHHRQFFPPRCFCVCVGWGGPWFEANKRQHVVFFLTYPDVNVATLASFRLCLAVVWAPALLPPSPRWGNSRRFGSSRAQWQDGGNGGRWAIARGAGEPGDCPEAQAGRVASSSSSSSFPLKRLFTFGPQ